MASKKKTITMDQATRGLYLDFEGKKDQPPMMCGVMVEGNFSQVVYDPAFEPAVRHARQEQGRPIQMADRDAFLTSLVERAIREDRHLIAFSNHELDVLEEFEAHPAEELTEGDVRARLDREEKIFLGTMRERRKRQKFFLHTEDFRIRIMLT